MKEPEHTPFAAFTRRQALRTSAGAIASTALTPELASALQNGPDAAHGPRRELSFDEGWRFYRGDASGAEARSFGDAAWRELDLPHDWRIEDLPYATSDDGGATADPSAFAFESKAGATGVPRVIGPFDADADTKPDLEVPASPVGPIMIPGGRGQGYTVAGVGWYRKHFQSPVLKPNGASGVGPQVELRFDGVYQNADVWLNGVHLGFHPNGYTSFAYDLTPHLAADGRNVLAVRVDNRGKTSRWYSGSGIYRHTWLTLTGPVRIPLWGVQVTTPVADARRSTAHVVVQVAASGTASRARVRMTVLDAGGRTVARQTTPPQVLASGAPETYSAELAIPQAALWSPETPNLYTVRTDVLVGEAVVDTVTTTFGIRSLVFSGAAGLLLNGKPYKVCGGNIHHDNGPLGAVALDRSEARRIEILKAAGFNAIRASHNPRSPYMLDVCDRLGMLVYNEFSDMWDVPKMADDYHLHFPQWWDRDLTSMVVRDRNHPSVIVWSIGNEISADPDKYGPRLAARVRSLDGTRPVALGGMNVGSFAKDAWSYVDIGDYHGAPPPADRAAHPDKAFLQSEDICAEIYNDWKLAQDNPWYVGSWIWSAWDYIGEAGGGATTIAKSAAEASVAGLGGAVGKVPYPWFNNCQSDIDLIGQRKPQNYYRAVVNGVSSLEIMVERPTPPGTHQFNVWYAFYDELPSWSWDVPRGQPMTVHVYTGGDSVTLLLDGKPVETKAVAQADKRIATFSVPYAPGTLTAVARRGGVEIARQSLATVGRPAAIRLASDVRALTTGRNDLAHVLVDVLDEQGNVVPDAVVKVSFAAQGAGELIGLGNGNSHNVDSFRRPRHWTWHGKALAILRPAKRPGLLSLAASAEELRPARLDLRVLPA